MSLELSLSDALSRFHEVSATTHQFWAYFQFVAAGAVTVAWAVRDRGSKGFCWLLTAGLTVFAIINGAMVYGSQQDMYDVAQAIRACLENDSCEVNSHLLPVTDSVSASEPVWIAAAYISLFVVTLVGIWLPNWRPSRGAS